MAVLLQLAARPGQVITRNELLEAVWRGTIVQEDALTQAVSQLRRLLDDDPRAPTIIETIPKQGYRLIASVVTPGAEVREAPHQPVAAAPRRHRLPRRWALGAVLAAGMVVTAVVLLRGGPRAGAPEDTATGWQELPLTALPGDEAYPAVSPDGTMVAFAGRPMGADDFRLQLLRRSNGEVIALTGEPGDETSPAWSPEGERLAFARQDADGRRVCVVAVIGGPVRELGPAHWLLGGLDWTADGGAIVYSAKDRQDAPMRLLRLQVADGRLDTLTAPEPLARGDTYPRFSPDGALLAFVRSDRGSSRDVFVMSADGGPARRLTHGFTTCGGLDWAPDGQALVLSATLRGPYELWRVPTDGAPATLLPARSHRALHPACGAGAGPLVFVDSVLDTDLEIRTIDGDGDKETQAVAQSTRLDFGGRFSPDGRTVLFISERGGSRELWLLDRGNGTVKQLTSIAGDALSKPRWSPDGRRVAVNVSRGGWLQIVVIDVASSLQRQVTPEGGHHRLGHWSADGTSIFYSRERGTEWQIGKVRLDGTGAGDVASPGCLTLNEQPNGALTYFKEAEPGIFRQQAGAPEELLAMPDDSVDLDNLEVAANGYWFAHTEGEHAWLAFHDFTTGRVRNVSRLPESATGEFHVSHDGREYLCVTVARSGSDLAIVPDPAFLTAPDDRP